MAAAAHIILTVTSPSEGALLPPRIVHLTGTIEVSGTNNVLTTAEVQVQLGETDTQPRVATHDPLGLGGAHKVTWHYDGALPDDVPDGASLRISVVGNGEFKPKNTPAEPIAADPGTAEVNVRIDSPPLGLDNLQYDAGVVPTSLPYIATITGTTAGAAAEVTRVRYEVQGGSPVTSFSGDAQSDPPGDWKNWTAAISLPQYGDFALLIIAEGTGQRVQSMSGFISVREQFEISDPERVFGPTIYVRELCDLLRHDVRVSGQPQGPDRATLARRFLQPIERIPDPAVYAAAVKPILQPRVAIDVLRRYLDSPVPAELDQRLRATAYEAVLGELGTSSDELRRTRVDDPSLTAALAAQLGIAVDRLADLTISPDEITDAQLEEIFGFTSLAGTDGLGSAESQPSFEAWQLTTLRSQWRAEDIDERDGPSGPLPVIDPDHVAVSNLQSQQPADPVRQLWGQRQDWVQSLAEELDQSARQGGSSTATFDLLVKTHIGSIDLADLADRDAAGEDVTGELAAVQLDRPGLRYLTRIRHLLTSQGLVAADWTEIRDVLVAIRKRRVFSRWREEERTNGIVLQPDQFITDPIIPATTSPPKSPSPWRLGRGVHEDWQRTLSVRASQQDRVRTDHQTTLNATEAAVLPAARDELLALIGARQSPPASTQDTAERLTRELCIDLLTQAPLLTTRADQAAETLLTALLQLRSGQFRPGQDGLAWSIVDDQQTDGQLTFDVKWQWMSSYQTWYAALTSFAYPENHLFPTVYLHDNVLSPPSPAYLDPFLPHLRAQRMTPQRARQVATDYWNAAAHLDPPLFESIKSFAPTAERHTNQQLVDLKTKLQPLYGQTASKDQLLFELFWLIPVALATTLQENGHFTAALDWYQFSYAYQLPTEQRRIFPGLVREHAVTSTYGRPPDWPANGTNPHEVAAERKDAYTRFTVMSIVRCLLAFADSEFIRDTSLSNARARTLYETALDLIGSSDAMPEAGPQVPFPANPVWAALQSQARTSLDKIHRGLNIASAQLSASDDQRVLPSQYRYGVLVDRAKNLVATAQQLESAYLAAAEQRDNDAYTALQASRDLIVAGAMMSVEDLKVASAGIGVAQAITQQEKAAVAFDHYDDLLKEDLSGYEIAQLAALGTAVALHGTAAGFSFGDGVGHGLSEAAAAAATFAELSGTKAGFERRRQEWQLQKHLADKDVELGREQVAIAQTQQAIAVREREIAGIQLTHAAATADFLATKFTNTELFEWMSGVLNRVYAYFLQQATALARLAQAQLAFERQEPNQRMIQDDYWQGPPDPATGNADTSDRRGLTGSARLLEDIIRLDQYAFETDRRKLHLTQTLSLSQFAARELQQFRQTGVLTFTTPQELFDADFPGHYLRLVHRIKGLSILALTRPDGIRAQLSASGLSRTVVARGPFETVTLRREPESIAFTSPINASGLFDLEPETGMLLPFEGMGVDTVWRLELPKPANPFDYRTIADVLLTIEYTALDSLEYRQKVIRSLNRGYSADRTFSLRSQFPDTWYDLNNPDTIEDPAQRMRAVLPLTADDFPPHISDLTVAELTLFVVRDDTFTDELAIAAVRHTTNGQAIDAGLVHTMGGIVGTRRPGGAPWQAFRGADPAGTWELQLEDTQPVRSWFADGLIQDLVLVMSLSGITPAWP